MLTRAEGENAPVPDDTFALVRPGRALAEAARALRLATAAAAAAAAAWLPTHSWQRCSRCRSTVCSTVHAFVADSEPTVIMD